MTPPPLDENVIRKHLIILFTIAIITAISAMTLIHAIQCE